MNINKELNGSFLRISLEGRLDTSTSPALEETLRTSLNGVTELELDFTGLEYISSSGLRVLLAAQKTMNQQGAMRLSHVNANIMDIFDITGFTDILTII